MGGRPGVEYQISSVVAGGRRAEAGVTRRAARLWAVLCDSARGLDAGRLQSTYVGAALTIAVRPLTSGLPSARAKCMGSRPGADVSDYRRLLVGGMC